jgi:CIC family chloride channel protein
MRKFTVYFRYLRRIFQTKKLVYKFFRWRYKHISNEQFINLISIVIGLLTGLAAVTIKNLTHLIQHLLEADFIHELHSALYFIFPIIGIALVILVIKYIIRKPVEDGVPLVLYAIMKLKSLIPSYHTYASLITAPLTVGFGGSVGLEGPSTLTGAALSSSVSRFFHLNLKQRNLLLGAAAAGTFASIFKAPIAGILFAVEIFGFDLTMTSLVPLILASVSGILTSYFFMGQNILLHFQLTHHYHFNDIPFFIILGITSATTSIYFVKVYYKIMIFFEKINNIWKRWAIAGLFLGLTIYFIPTLYGEGFEILNHILLNNYHFVVNTSWFTINHNDTFMIIMFFILLVTFKVVAMSLTFSAGGIGGVFAPTLFTGAISGYTFALMANYTGLFSNNLSTENYALVGMAGTISGVLQAPLTAIFLIVEITGGYELIVPIMLVAAISYLISKKVLKYSIYTMQLAEIDALPTHDKDKFAGKLIEWKEVIEKDFIPVKPSMSLGYIVYNVVTRSHRHIFPVIDDDNRFIGYVSLDDIRHIMFNRDLYDNTFVKDLMHKAPEVIFYEKDHFPDIMQKFKETAAWNLPIVKDDKYLGFISKSKLLSVYRRKLLELTSE